MKVAIMGAGLSGLSCAITLEKNGIHPVIFENRSKVGDRFVHGEILLSILNRPIFDSISYFCENYGIFLHPTSNIKNLFLHSENKEALVKGHLGFTNIRGRHENSFENQLAKQVKSKIVFNSKYVYEDLIKDFTHVVIATGDAEYAMKVQDYQKDLTVTLKGATIEGHFDLYAAYAWLNNDFTPKGYGYLIPYSQKEANVVIAYPDYPENKKLDIDLLWEKFYDRVCRDLKQNFKITDGFQVRNYIIGICKYPRIGNTFFVGNCFGSIMPFLGFGQFMAILTGIYAAYDICGIGNYEELTKPFQDSYKNSLVLRHALEKLDNRKLDKMTDVMNGYVGQKLFNTKYKDPLKLISYLLRIFNS